MMSGAPISNPSDESDTQALAAMVAAIAAGDREAESRFVARFMPKVRTLLMIRSRNPELARDLQQDVMIEALVALRKGQLREADRLPAFVAGIARNLLNNHFRNQTRTPVHEELPPELVDPWEENPLDSQAATERRQLADKAIASLEPVDRSILQMTMVDDLKPGVIAERLGLSSDVVRQRKLRATRRVMEFVRQLSQSPGSAHLQAGELS
jgi:RNA polymerase sigma factor (sigma-70 family)